MAAKLIVALACFALCNSSPLLLKGYLFRDGRGYSIGQGYTNNPGGRASGTATINGGVIHAYGTATSNDQNQLGRYIGAFPGEAVAKAEVYDGPQAAPVVGSAKAVADAHNKPTYYTVPAPATIVSYEQNFEVPTPIRYEYPGTIAESTAILNDNSESAVTSARADGPGVAESSAKTQGIGSYGVTTSNAKTFGSGFGTASSNSNNGYGTANTVARTQGFGSASSTSQNGHGLTSAESQTNGGYASSAANNAADSSVVTSNTQGVASSKANINSNPGAVVSSAKTNDGKGIHWHFGTAYNVPSQQVSSQANGGAAKSTAHTNGVLTTSDAQGYASSNANSNLQGGHVDSVANSNGIGYGAAKYVGGNGYGSANSALNNGLGNIRSTANTNGYGNANAHADINEYAISSVANSNGQGTAASSVDSAQNYSSLRSDGLPNYYSVSRPRVTAQTFGQGSASAKTQGLNTGYRVINSAANSFGHGSAQANASA